MAAAALLAATLSGCGGQGAAAAPDLSALPGYNVISGDPLGPATQSVTETDGTTWSFSHPASGEITLLYFGYTSCPDVCPTTMADLASALTRVPADVRDKIWVQFVSTDPHRDTDGQITRWLKGFDPTFHGARAPIDTVIAAARSYAVAIEAPKVTKGDYQVTHGSQLFVLDPQGGAVGFFGDLVGSKDYATALTDLVDTYA